MHLVTISARLSRSVRAFSVPIQHSVAARAWVIGGSGGLAATGAGPAPVVSQPASAKAARTISGILKATRIRVDGEFIELLRTSLQNLISRPRGAFRRRHLMQATDGRKRQASSASFAKLRRPDSASHS